MNKFYTLFYILLTDKSEKTHIKAIGEVQEIIVLEPSYVITDFGDGSHR